MSDLVLAIAHHLIVFALAAVLAAKLALMRPAVMSPAWGGCWGASTPCMACCRWRSC